MKKICVVVCCVILFVMAGCIVYCISHDDWEEACAADGYFYGDELFEEGKEKSVGAQWDYQKERFRKIKLIVTTELVNGDCRIELKDEEGNIIEEWKMNGQDTYELEMNRDLREQFYMVCAVTNEKDCTGRCSFSIYGKRKWWICFKEMFVMFE